MDAERRADIVRRLRHKQTVSRIITDLHCGRDTIQRICEAEGIPYEIQERGIGGEKHAKIVNRLKAGDPIRTIARQENVGRETVKRICRATEARPLPPKNGRPQGESLRVSGEIDYKPVLEYPCENGHRTIYYPCPVCIALRANASCTPEKRKTFSQVTF